MSILILIAGIFASLLLAAALFDLVSYTIPNRLIGAMLALFVIFLIALATKGHPIAWHDLRLHLLSGAVALALGIALFAPGWIGGGDAKLFAVVCLWLGWRAMLDYAVIASMMGGALTIAILTFRSVPLPPGLAARRWRLKLAAPELGIPYGVALSLAALAVLPDTELFRLAVS